MRLAFIADSRAEHTRHWVRYFTKTGDDVLLLSTFPGPDIPGVQVWVLPGLFRVGNALIKNDGAAASARQEGVLRFVFRSGLSKALYPLWQQMRALEVLSQAPRAQEILNEFRPDIVHAMRIQNEGYVGGWAHYHPFVLSSWGSDFMSMAARYPVHGLLTRSVVKKPDAFIADCWRDERFARGYGLPSDVPTRVFPGNGGIDRDFFHPGQLSAQARDRIILYARGVSPFARIDTLLKAVKLMTAQEADRLTRLILLIPRTVTSAIDRMRRKLSLPEAQVIVRSSVSREELVRLLQTAAVSVSAMVSDGTPISMLEAMACGAFPVMSNLESIREWITHGVNGLLFDPNDPEELAACLQEGLDNWPMRQAAQEINSQLIRDRADYVTVMSQVRQFYEQISYRYAEG